MGFLGLRTAQRTRALDAIRRAAHYYPEQRITQLIVNATGKSDPFYVEDDELERDLHRYIEKRTG